MNVIALGFIGLAIWMLMGLVLGLLAGVWVVFAASAILFVFAALFFGAAFLFEWWSS